MPASRTRVINKLRATVNSAHPIDLDRAVDFFYKCTSFSVFRDATSVSEHAARSSIFIIILAVYAVNSKRIMAIHCMKGAGVSTAMLVERAKSLTADPASSAVWAPGRHACKSSARSTISYAYTVSQSRTVYSPSQQASTEVRSTEQPNSKEGSDSADLLLLRILCILAWSRDGQALLERVTSGSRGDN